MTTPLLDMIDICENRHRGAETSIAAFEKVKHTKQLMYDRIMYLAQQRKDYGITVHDVSHQFGKTPNEVSGRLSELKMLGKLKKSGLRRNGAAVLILC